MKAAPYFFYLLLLSLSGYSPGLRAQRGIGTANPAASAALEVASTNRGLLIPRVGLVSPTQWAPITGLATHTSDGMLVYNASPTLSGEGLYYWETASPTSAWKVVGNNLYTKDGGLAGNRVIQSGGQDLNIRMNASGRFVMQSLTRSTTFVDILARVAGAGSAFVHDPLESIRYINAVNTNANTQFPRDFMFWGVTPSDRARVQRVGQATYWGYAIKLKPDKAGVVQEIMTEIPGNNPATATGVVPECYYQGSLLFRGNRQPNPGPPK